MKQRSIRYLVACILHVNLVLCSLVSLYAQNLPAATSRPPATAVTVPSAYTNTTINYIRTWEPSMPTTDTNVVKSISRTVAEVKQNTQYFDGLGRPLQTVSKGISAGGKDLVAPVVYDAFSREQYKYLPYVPQTGNTNDGKFKTDPFNVQKAFYQSSALNPGVAGEAIYYGQTEYEASPLNRVSNTNAPGNSWAKEGGNRPVQNQYLINTAADSIRIWDLTAVIPTSGSGRLYAAGVLYKNVVIDEAGSQIVEYKDKEDRIVLKKVQLAASNPGTAHMGWLCTYYVYDDLGNLRFVIPPKAVDAIKGSWSISTAIAAELCFIYRYDGRNRMIVKKVPGADSTEMVYDVRDRLAFSRDGNLKNPNQPGGAKWLVTFYDGLNRPTMTALYNNNTTRDALQASMNTATSNTQSISYTFPGTADLVVANYDGITHSYQATNSITLENGFDSGTGADITAEINPSANNGATTVTVTNPLPNIPASALTFLTYTFYDDYSYTGKQNAESGDFSKPQYTGSPYAEVITATSNMTRGLVTGTKVRVLGTNQWLTTTTWYTDKGRVLQTISDNIGGGKDILTGIYDFSGKLLSTYQRHKNLRSGTTPQTTVMTQLLYDAAGRLKTVKKRLNDNTALERTIADNTYDELGQLQTKRLGVTSTTAQIETLSYEYNIRGWLKGINKGFVNTSSTSNWFGQELSYDYGFGTNQYNGNIAGIKWKSKNNGIARAYGYNYDNASRLTVADFTQQNSGSTNWTRDQMDFSVSALTYDANGNIGTMTQKGMAGTAIATIDQLSYTYQANSNKLAAVADPSNTTTAKLGDFINGSNTGDDYAYDVNGNLTKDLNKNIATITYNHLNLPDNITITGKGSIKYQYDAAGNKLKKIVTDNTGSTVKTTITDYIGGFVYQNDTLQFVSHEEGRVRTVFQTGQPIKYNYDYFVKDHLGNVRTVLTEQTDFSMYTATMEAESAATETALFSNVEETRSTKPVGYPEDQTTSKNEYVAKLNAKDGGKKIGPSLVLKVMAGDTIQIGAKAFYKSTGPPQADNKSVTPEDMVTNLIQVFAGGKTSSDGAHAARQADQLSPFAGNFTGNDYQRLKEKDPNQNQQDKPKAYLNFVLFDDQFNLVEDNSGVRQVKGEPDELQTLAVDKMPIKKSGFLYVYTSNETQQDVLFDNVTVAAISGPLLEETHYYPFGLTMAGISSNALKGKNYPENKKKYQQYELNSDFDINLYESFYRSHDPQLGRFLQVDPKPNFSESPYVAMGNNSISNMDPLGDTLLNKADHRIANRIEKQINSTNASLNRQASKLNSKIAAAEAKGNTAKADNLRARLNNATSRVSANTTTLSRLNAIRSDQKQAYTFNQLPAGSIEGGTTLGVVKNSAGENQIAVVMSIVGDANAVHELTHAYQGGIEHSIRLTGSGASFPGPNLFAQQMTNANAEVEAYRAQYGFAPATMPSSTMGGTPQSMSGVNDFYVGGINDNSTPPQSVYPHVRDMVNTIFQLLRIF